MPPATLHDIPIQGKRLCIRVDCHVPLTTDHHIVDDTRIRAALPTLVYALQHGARVVLASHLGRPTGHVDPALSLRPVAARLQTLLRTPIRFAPDCVGEDVEQCVRALAPGEVLLLENLRCHPEEEANEPACAQALACLGEVYVHDAFGAAHRAHASTAGIALYLQPAVAGLLMDREMTSLGKATAHPDPPFVAVLGGAKVSEKLPLLTQLLDKASGLLLGGGMASTLLPAQGYAVGNSLVEPQCIALARDVCTRAVTQGRQLVLPSDHVIAQAHNAQRPTRLVAAEGISDGWMGLDIGPRTIKQFQEVLAHARTMVWNGPMGVCELSPFRQGTCALAHAVAACKGTTIVGGGDTIAALTLAGCTEAITHVSTGGGASLACLEGKVLPGIACLNAR